MPFCSSVEGSSGFGRPTPATTQATTTAVLYYDPANSTSYPGSGTTVYNAGTGGTMTGSMTNVSYVSGGGGYFNFTATGSIRFTSAFNFTNTMTICAWVYPSTQFSINTLVANCAANTNTNGFKVYWNGWNTSNGYTAIEAGNGSTGGTSTSGTAVITIGAWQHLAWVWNVSSRIMSFYKNGTLIATANPSAPPSNPNMNQAWDIGYMKGSYSMNARLGYLKAWTSILSTADVAADYNASKARFGL